MNNLKKKSVHFFRILKNKCDIYNSKFKRKGHVRRHMSNLNGYFFIHVQELFVIPLEWLISFMNRLHDIKSCFMTIAQYDAEIFKQRFHYKICMKIAHFFCRQIPSWHKITKVAHIFLEQILKSSKKLRKSFITKYQKEYFNSENELKIKLL